MSKSIEQKYIKLSDIDHVLKRSGMYLGNINPHTEEEWVFDETLKKMVKKSITYSPAFIKMFDEIISNSVDESKRNPKLDEIKVEITDDGWISIWDNGGIPVQIHSEHNMYVPEMIFSELKAGSNFDDDIDQTVAGQNGVGSTLTNIFSKEFIVTTADGKNRFKQTFKNNLSERSTPQIKESTEHYTRIQYFPDYDRLKCSLDADTKLKLQKRVIDIAGTNPNLKIKFNNETIKIKTFEDYVQLYTPDYEYDENENWRVGIAQSKDGFENISFVNSTATKAGTHIDYVSNQVVNEIRTFLEKKHKVKIYPSEIKKHFFLFIDCKIVNPRYDSQTKEKLISEVKDYKTEYKASQKFINKMLKSPIIGSILSWLEAMELQKELEKQKKLNKDAGSNLKKIVKLSDAASKERDKCILFLCEGDSAKNFIMGGRDPETMAAFPLKGKPVNVYDVEFKELLENDEFRNIVSIVGLQLGKKVETVADIRYGKIVIAADSDLDGNHVSALLINMLYKFWPELFKLGIIARFMTAIVKVVYQKQTIKFYTTREFDEWKKDKDPKSYKSFYYKGLGTSTDEEVEEYFAHLDENLVDITSDSVAKDSEMLGLAFDETRPDDRKKWLAIGDF